MTSQSTQEARRRAHRPELSPDPPRRPGAVEVTREELRALPQPARTATWEPLRHDAVVTMAEDALAEAGVVVRSARYLLGRGKRRLAAVLDTATELVEGVNVRLVVRSSQDRSATLTLAVGALDVYGRAAWVYHAERHPLRYTPGVLCRVPGALRTTLAHLPLLWEREAGAVRELRRRDLTSTHADSILLHAWERGVVPVRLMPAVLRAWRDGGEPVPIRGTGWGLLVALARGLGTLWTRDVDAFRRLHAARWHVETELAGH